MTDFVSTWNEESFLTTPVAPLGLIAMRGTEDMGDKVNKWLLKWRKYTEETLPGDMSTTPGMGREDFLVRATCPRFGNGEGKGLIKDSVRGLDLYILTEKDGWRFAGSGFEWGGRDKEVKNKTMVSNMEPSMREYMLYLSLYNGISSLEIGVDEGAVIEAPSIDSPRSDRPIVMYGTSILQGGCASRPGMAFTAILGRKLDREIINLGFSGNAWLDYEIAEYITRAQNPALIVLDYVPNSTAEMIDERGERFFRIVRQAFPDVPVIFVEDPTFPHTRFDRNMLEEVTSKNEAQKALYRRLKKAGEKKLYYVGTEGMIGDDGEATVDGIHLTDLGMMRYVDKLYPVMRKALR